MAFLEDPRLRQRWNQISHTTEAVTENAAAGIWSFGHSYVNPCLSSVAASLDGCVTLCLGDREERARRSRDRQRARGRAEYSFDFYDDWEDEFYADADQGSGSARGAGLLGGWRSEDWDRLLAGTGKRKSFPPTDHHHSNVISDQPRAHAGASAAAGPVNYGTRTAVHPHDDPTIIPSTARIGFLGRLPFRFGGTLRYKPSAANLQEHPGALKHDSSRATGEREPLLGGGGGAALHDMSHNDDDRDYHYHDDGSVVYQDEAAQPQPQPQPRKRSGTAGSGDTSDSYRSRGDLFPSDGEGDEDAVPLDDDLAAVVLGRVDSSLDRDRRSSASTTATKGKRVAPRRSDDDHYRAYRADGTIPRSVSRTTLDSTRASHSQQQLPTTPTSQQQQQRQWRSFGSSPGSMPALSQSPQQSPRSASGVMSLDDLRQQEEAVRQEEDREVEEKRQAAAELARRRGLGGGGGGGQWREEDTPKVEEPAPSAEAAAAARLDAVAGPEQAAIRKTPELVHHWVPEPASAVVFDLDDAEAEAEADADVEVQAAPPRSRSPSPDFVPARLPHFR